MRRFRQWLAEKQDHMTESPDGDYVLYADALADKEAAVREITESRDYWKREWFLMEAVENKAEGQIAALTAELKSLTEAYNNTDWKKRTDVLIEAIKLAYRKHHLNDDTIGWEELSEALLNSLCETMGDKGYQDWIDALKQGEEATNG